MTQEMPGQNRERSPVPLRALFLSLLALTVPISGAMLAPEWMTEEVGVLLWLTALIPPFLLTYYRGWKGASVGLAAGMAALALTQVALVTFDLGAPDFRTLFWLTATLILVCVGIGLLAELLRRERRAAESMALTDPLTGLPNRRYASVFLDAAFASGIRGEPVCVVLMDLDRFKDVNDRFGHRAGDEVLRAFGRALIRVTRRMDLSARWGGEEFLSILSNCTAEGAESFTERVRREFRESEFPWGQVTFSAGIAQYTPGTESAELLVSAADTALYRAKEEGRNCHRIAEPPAVKVEVPLWGDGEGPEAPKSIILEERTGGMEAGERERGLLFSGEEDELLLHPEGGFLPGGRERIIVVDDDVVTRKGLARFLRRLGYHTVEAPDGPSALATARSLEGVDLLVTDLIMPGMSGFSLAERMQSADGPLRVLYISGHVHDDISWAGAPGAIREHLLKPLDAAEVARTVRELLDRPLPRVQQHAERPGVADSDRI